MNYCLAILFMFSLGGIGVSDDSNSSVHPTRQELEALYSIRGKVKGEIIFESKRGAFWAIWKMNADGTHLKRITDEKSNDRNPVGSYDGKLIYFNSNRTGHHQIYSMNPDGGDIKNLSQSDKDEILWSVTQDNTKIFFKTRQDGEMAFFVRELATGNVKQIDFSEFPGKDGKIEPRVSPDGQKIAFLFKGGKSASRAVYVGDLDSSYKVKNIVKIHLGCFSAWSRDSSRFIMCFFTHGGTALHLIEPGSKEFISLTEGGRWNYFPAWSPNEDWFVWAASPTPYHDFDKSPYDIYIASTKDKKPIRLTFDPAPDLSPSWRSE